MAVSPDTGKPVIEEVSRLSSGFSGGIKCGGDMKGIAWLLEVVAMETLLGDEDGEGVECSERGICVESPGEKIYMRKKL